MRSDLVSHMLDKLLLLGLVRKEEPFGMKKSKDPHYVIGDRLLASYFAFVYPEYADMAAKDIDAAYDALMERLDGYLGHVFEDICHEFIRLNGFLRSGRWWKGSVEIDMIAVSGDTMLFAECKYRNELTDADLIDSMIEKSKMVDT